MIVYISCNSSTYTGELPVFFRDIPNPVEIKSLACNCYFNQDKHIWLQMMSQGEYYLLAHRFFPEGFHAFDWVDHLASERLSKIWLPKASKLFLGGYGGLGVQLLHFPPEERGVIGSEYIESTIDYEEIIPPEPPAPLPTNKFSVQEPTNSWNIITASNKPAFESRNDRGNTLKLRSNEFTLAQKITVWAGGFLQDTEAPRARLSIIDPQDSNRVYYLRLDSATTNDGTLTSLEFETSSNSGKTVFAELQINDADLYPSALIGEDFSVT